MKHWLRISLIIVVIVGGVGAFGYYSLSKLNQELDTLSAVYVTAINTRAVRSSTELASTTAMHNATSTTAIASSTLALLLPKDEDLFYSGCTYRVALDSEEKVRLLEVVLVDVETKETIGPIASGLQRSLTVSPDKQSFDWKIGSVLPATYLMRVTKANEAEQRVDSRPFEVRKPPAAATTAERESLCKASGGSVSL